MSRLAAVRDRAHSEPARAAALADIRRELERNALGLKQAELIRWLLAELAIVEAERDDARGFHWNGEAAVWAALSVRAQNLLLDHGIDTTAKLLALDVTEVLGWECGGNGLATQLRGVQDALRARR